MSDQPSAEQLRRAQAAYRKAMEEPRRRYRRTMDAACADVGPDYRPTMHRCVDELRAADKRAIEIYEAELAGEIERELR